nr:hypothetical protein [uncultured Ralstonia sp.]
MSAAGFSRTQWAKMPCGWQTDFFVHHQINGMPAGQAIAALKIYIGLVCRATYRKRDDLPAPGCARLTLSDLCELLDVSRPMVVAGIGRLLELELIELLEKRPAVYRLAKFETCDYWTKLPSGYLYGADSMRKLFKIADLSNRSGATLHALQLYLYLASVRDKHTLKATVSYTRMDDTLCMTRNEISRGLSLLISHSLIGSRLGDPDPATRKRPANVYWLQGRIGARGEDDLLGDEAAPAGAGAQGPKLITS